MCDYSLQSNTVAPAKVGDRLTTRNLSTGIGDSRRQRIV
jgi:hypothetical protein